MNLLKSELDMDHHMYVISSQRCRNGIFIHTLNESDFLNFSKNVLSEFCCIKMDHRSTGHGCVNKVVH